MLRKRKHHLTAYIFAVVGIGLLGVAIMHTLTQYDFVTHSEIVKGRVVELVSRKSDNGYVYAPQIEFSTKEDEVVTFTSGVYSGTPGYREGQVVSVRYKQTDPQGAEVDSFFVIWFASIILWVMGLVFSATGISIVSITFIRNSIIKRLEVSHREVEAKIMDVKRSSFGRNNNFPYIIYAEFADGGRVYTFKSDPIPFNPADMLKRPTIKVLVDPSDYKKYYVDVDSALEEQAVGDGGGVG